MHREIVHQKPFGIVYLIENRINGKAYIGLTKQTLSARWYHHKYNARKGGTTPFYNAIRKYGENAWDLSILQTYDTEVELIAGDIYWINKLGTKIETGDGYNATDGGHLTRHCEETKNKIREKQIGRPSPKKGKKYGPLKERRKSPCKPGHTVPHSEETKEKLRQISTGKKLSETTREKISRSNQGRTHSEESKELKTQKAKCRVHSEETKRKISETKRRKNQCQQNQQSTEQSYI